MTVDAASITDTTGAISFGDNNLTTTGVATAGSFVTGTLTVDAASITDTTGAISFGDNNLTTTGVATAGSFVTGTLTVDAASITDTTGAISFGDNNLTTTGVATAGSFVTGTLTVDAASITDTTGAISFGDNNLTTTGTLDCGDITISNASNIILNTDTGTKIGTATNQKLGFFNATPVEQRASSEQAALDTTTNSVGTAIANKELTSVGDTSTGDQSATIMNNIATLAASINEIRTVLVNLGLMKGAAA